jgi:prophage antirepressor-like protein
MMLVVNELLRLQQQVQGQPAVRAAKAFDKWVVDSMCDHIDSHEQVCYKMKPTTKNKDTENGMQDYQQVQVQGRSRLLLCNCAAFNSNTNARCNAPRCAIA